MKRGGGPGRHAGSAAARGYAEAVPEQVEREVTHRRGLGTGREIGLATAVFVLTFGLLMVRLLVPRAIGAADNGDGKRVLCGLGIQWETPAQDFARTAYTEPILGCKSDYFLSQIWFLRAAQWVGRIVGTESTVNLVIVGILSSILVAASVALIALGAQFPWRYRLALSAGVLLVLADSAFFGYFSSVLGEGPAFIGITLMVGGMLLMSRTGWWRYLGMAVTIGGGIIGVNAKVQTLMILPILLLALVFIRPDGMKGIARWAPVGLVFAAVLNGTLYLQPPLGEETGPGQDTREINMFNTIFMSIVDGEHDTGADLAALGLPESFGQYAANGWWHPHPARFDPLYPQYREKISRRNVVEYFAEHPDRTVQILNRAATDLLKARPEYLASFTREAGYPPLTLEYRVPVFSGITAFIAPLGLWVLIPLWLLIAFAAVRAWRSPLRIRQFGVVILFLLGIALGQFPLAALGDGIENIKHQSVALFCTLLGLVLSAATLVRNTADGGRDEPTVT